MRSLRNHSEKTLARTKSVTFALSAALAASAGALYARYASYIDPSSFTVAESILVVSMVIVGGAGSLWGALVGAVLLITLPEGLRFVGLPAGFAANLRQILYGGLLVTMMVVRPQGLIGRYDARQVSGNGRAACCVAKEWSRRLAESRPWPASTFACPLRELLVLSGQTVRAKRRCSTSLLVLCARTPGAFHGVGTDLARLSPHQVARLGVVRTFQQLRLIQNMSVEENVLLARPRQRGEQLWSALLPIGRDIRDQANRAVAAELLGVRWAQRVRGASVPRIFRTGSRSCWR